MTTTKEVFLSFFFIIHFNVKKGFHEAYLRDNFFFHHADLLQLQHAVTNMKLGYRVITERAKHNFTCFCAQCRWRLIVCKVLNPAFNIISLILQQITPIPSLFIKQQNFELFQIKAFADNNLHMVPMMEFVSDAGSKEFQNSYSSACHFALVLQLDKEG